MKILIIEDEFPIALDIKTRLEQIGYNDAKIAVSYSEAVQLLATERFDFALLDINLNDKHSGIELGILIKKYHKFPIIFITAYTDDKTFEQAQKALPMGYITKPFKDIDLKNNIKLALKKYSQIYNSDTQADVSEKFIFVKERGVIHKINTDKINWIEAKDNYTVIHTDNKNYVTYAFLKDILSKIGSNFVRIHRSHAVAINKITEISNNIVSINSEKFALSKKYKADLFSKLNIL